MMKGVEISFFLLLILLSGSLGEEEGETGLKRKEENVRGVGIANGRERRKLSGSLTQDKTAKSFSRGLKGEKRESRNLLGSLQAPYRRQPLRLPGVGTPRGFIKSRLRWR